jgi:hypothetical protein
VIGNAQYVNAARILECGATTAYHGGWASLLLLLGKTVQRAEGNSRALNLLLDHPVGCSHQSVIHTSLSWTTNWAVVTYLNTSAALTTLSSTSITPLLYLGVI